MYFVQFKPLKEKLRRRNLTDSEVLPYLVLYFACWTLFEAIPVSAGSFNRFGGLLIALEVTFVMCGIVYTYSRNDGNQGFDFFRKFIVLGWVLTVRFTIAIMLFVVFIILLSKISGTDIRVQHSVLSVVLTVLYYLRLGKHVGDTTEA